MIDLLKGVDYFRYLRGCFVGKGIFVAIMDKGLIENDKK
jgi:hypothetical protein